MGAGMMVLAVLLLAAVGVAAQDLPRSVVPFDRAHGNHRVRVRVEAAGDAARVHIAWQRRDAESAQKNVVVTDAKGAVIANRLVIAMSAESGDIVFQPSSGPGDYFVYYLPYTQTGWMYMPKVAYDPPKATADPAWLTTNGLPDEWRALPEARVVGIESRTEFDRFTDMEVVATDEQLRGLNRMAEGKGYLVFPEDRLHPIRMADRLPSRWAAGPAQAVTGNALCGECFAYQIGVWAGGRALENVSVSFEPLKGPGGEIPGSAIRCLNAGGTDWLGRRFTKKVSVPAGRVQALWCLVDVPKALKPGTYTGQLTVKPSNAPMQRVPVRLTVTARVAKNGGEGDAASMARLRWLDSAIGLDDEVVAPFTPLKVKGSAVECLQRKVVFGPTGLPERIVSKGHEVLAAPIGFWVMQGGLALPWTPGKTRKLKMSPAILERETVSTAGNVKMTCRSKMEADGYVGYTVTLTASADTALENVALDIPYRLDAAIYFMGLGRKGGFRPKEWSWKWDIARANNMFWIGSTESGMWCKLKTATDSWDLYNLAAPGLPDSWSNGGKGGVTVSEGSPQGNGDPSRVHARAFTGARLLKAGKPLVFKFALLVTPVKPLDPKHWRERYDHSGAWVGKSPGDFVKMVQQNEATIVNVHQGNAWNPYINYPFPTVDQLRTYADAAHKAGLKLKIYYTVRELSNRVAEMWALRSLGFEVFTDGPGGGDSWLQEHLGSHYAPAWHSPLADGGVDAAIATVGLSRWHNTYLEGLRWLIQNAHIDGLYLDGIGYDREIMKRVRKVMDRAKPGCLIDFHSGNNYDPAYGLNSCANGYMEHFPYLDSLWFGEGFNYNESPDYWLVEVSGIPFGLYGEMLQDNGNPWRGMVYGMTARYYSGADPKHLWRVWDSFGIEKAKMIGYWSPQCPVRTSDPAVLATAYVRKGQTLISVASWAPGPVKVRLRIDWMALGLDPARAKLEAPVISGFQPAKSFAVDEEIPVEPGKGWLVVVRESAVR